jgi:NAD+ kinase
MPIACRCTVWVSFDGKQRQELRRGDRLCVRMSPNPVPTINKVDQTNDWFCSLERCFGWNDRYEQKPLSIRGSDRGSDEINNAFDFDPDL